MRLRQRVLDKVRIFNKRYFNRFSRRFAGKAHGPFALIRHVGYKTGTIYETPVVAIPIPQAFIVALTYGLKVDWYRNIKANGKCAVIWREKTYEISSVRDISANEGLPVFPGFVRALLKLNRIRDFIRLEYQSRAAAGATG